MLDVSAILNSVFFSFASVADSYEKSYFPFIHSFLSIYDFISFIRATILVTYIQFHISDNASSPFHLFKKRIINDFKEY